MVVLDEDFGTNLTLVEGNGGVRLSPVSVPEHAPRDWRSQCERERARADAAEARAEELRWAEVAARSDGRFVEVIGSRPAGAGMSEAVEETQEARRTARDVPSLQAEVARLETLLTEAGIASDIRYVPGRCARRPPGCARPWRQRRPVRAATGSVARSEPPRRTALEPSPDQKETDQVASHGTIRRLDKEVVRRDKEIARLNTRLDQEKERTERIRETASKLSSESLRLHREVRILGHAEARARSLSDEVFWLRHALEVSKAGKEKLKARLAKLRAAGATLSKLPSDEAAQLRAADRGDRGARRRRSRRCARTTAVCAGPCGSWRPGKRRWLVQPAKLRAIRKALESELAGLRAVRKTLSKSLSVADADLRRACEGRGARRLRSSRCPGRTPACARARRRRGTGSRRWKSSLRGFVRPGRCCRDALYGRKSEQQDKPGSEHKRGQQRGAPGHGRTQRPGLDERTEEHNPPPDACVCGRCGQPYAPNGAEESTLVEIEVKAHKRVIRRPRWRRTCECASSPMEVSAPPVPRLFPRTLYGTSFWARFLFEHCACFRPVHRVAAWMSAQWADGLAGDAGRQPEAVRAAARAAGRGDPCAPEQGGAAPCRRDQHGACRNFAGKTARAAPGCGPRSAVTRSLIAVGTLVAQRPPHRSGQAR